MKPPRVIGAAAIQAPAHTASLLAPYLDDQGNPTTDTGPVPY